MALELGGEYDSYGNYRQFRSSTERENVGELYIRNVQNSKDGWMGRYTAHDTSTSCSESPGGSQAALLSTKEKKERWVHSPDFLSAVLAFSLSLHSIWYLPISIIQHGGLAFLLMYFLVLLLVGAPVLLLEMFLGQYSGLAPMRLFRHLCPILSGLGLTIFVQAAVRLFLELGVLSWSGQTLFLVFSQQNIRDGFFYRDVLNKDKGDLEELGSVSGELCLVLGIGTVLIFILVAAGARSVGKVCMVLTPLMFMLIVSLTIRSCIAEGGLQGVTMLLTPNWIKLTDPTAWLEATSQVVFSLQLGIGAVLSYGSYNKFNQNIVRDAIIVLISHLVWVLLSVLLILSLLGISHTNKVINLTDLASNPVLASDPVIISITGQGMWLLGVTALESAISSLSYGWLWGGLLFVLIVLVCISSIFGYLEVMTGSIVAIRPSLIPYRPLITFLILVVFFLLDIFMTTQGGINVYHLVNTYIATWPQLLIVLLTVLPAVLCHGTRNMMKDLSEMSKVCFHHFVTSHLSTLYYTVIPLLILGGLCWSLHLLSLDHLLAPLATFRMSLPPGWGMPLGWALSFLPLSPLVLGGLVHLIFGARGVPRVMHLKGCVRPTDRYYRNEHLELAAEQNNRNVSVV